MSDLTWGDIRRGAVRQLRAAGIARDWKQGLGAAADAIDSGRAAGTLERWAKISQA